jgi:hypothetical protein
MIQKLYNSLTGQELRRLAQKPQINSILKLSKEERVSQSWYILIDEQQIDIPNGYIAVPKYEIKDDKAIKSFSLKKTPILKVKEYVENYINSAVKKLGDIVGSPTGFDSYRSIPPYFEVPHYVNKATTDDGVNLLVDVFNTTVLVFEYVAIQNEKLKNGEMGLNQEEFIAGLPKYKILELDL